MRRLKSSQIYYWEILNKSTWLFGYISYKKAIQPNWQFGFKPLLHI